jgi:hypothetical protein
MVNYQNGKIYRLDCGNLIYIGSTTYQLSLRKAIHKTEYLRGKTCRSKLLYQYALDNGLSLIEDIRIELICDCPCNNKEDLDAIEGKYIRQFKSEYGENCVNKNIPGRTKKQYYDDNKDCFKKYYKLNKDKIKEYYENNKDKVKQYYEDNKDKISQQQQKYYKDNRDKAKEYYEKNKDRITEYQQQYRLFKKIDKIFYY